MSLVICAEEQAATKPQNARNKGGQKLKHEIPENAKNSSLIFLIDEYVRLERDREILKNHWFKGMTFEQLAHEHKLSVNAVKNIIYGIGDRILLKLK